MSCAICSRDKISESEGRIIDESWREDKKVLGRYMGKWVCSWTCYRKTWKKKN